MSHSLPPNAFEAGDKSGTVIATCAAMIALSTTAVALRVFSRVVAKNSGWWWDDSLAVVSWVLFLPLCGVFMALTDHGLGKHVGFSTTHDIQQIELLIYIGEIFYNFSLTLAKLSALLFYVRIFTTNKMWFRIAVWLLGSLCVGWCLGITFAAVFQCSPIDKAWLGAAVEGSCLKNTYGLFLGTIVTNVIIDFFILILPIPILRGLHTDAKTKAGLLFIFILGYSVLAISIARLVYLTNLQNLADITWAYVTEVILFTLEPGIAVISVCLPSCVYLVRYIAKYSMKLPFVSSSSSLSIRGEGGAHHGTLAEPFTPEHRTKKNYQELEVFAESSRKNSVEVPRGTV